MRPRRCSPRGRRKRGGCGKAGDYGPLMAGYVLSSLPLAIIFLFTMKYYIAGLTAGALKV